MHQRCSVFALHAATDAGRCGLALVAAAVILSGKFYFDVTASDLRRSTAVDRCISLEQLAASDGYNPLLPWLCSGGGALQPKEQTTRTDT